MWGLWGKSLSKSAFVLVQFSPSVLEVEASVLYSEPGRCFLKLLNPMKDSVGKPSYDPALYLPYALKYSIKCVSCLCLPGRSMATTPRRSTSWRSICTTLRWSKGKVAEDRCRLMWTALIQELQSHDVVRCRTVYAWLVPHSNLKINRCISVCENEWLAVCFSVIGIGRKGKEKSLCYVGENKGLSQIKPF